MPRVVPKLDPLDLAAVSTEADARRAESARRTEAARLDLKAERAASLDAALRSHDVRGESGNPLFVRERSWYGPSSQFSYFRDLVSAAADAQLREHGITHGAELDHPTHGSVEEARRRLRVEDERRTLTTTATAGGNFVPPGPAYLGDMFAAAARAAGKLPAILPQEPLPEKGIFSLTTPRITTGATVAVQATQNAAVSNTDIVESDVPNPVATISGFEDLSQQLLDHSYPGMDAVLSKDLGRAFGLAADQQILAGIGSAGQMLGLAAVTGITSSSYTDASPTQAEAWPTVMKLYADVSTAVGDSATAILQHPRRRAWFETWKDSATGAKSPLSWPCPMYEVPAIATAEGASTNQDAIYVLRVEELPYYATDPVYQVIFDMAGSNTMTARVRVYGYLSALFSRRPEAVGKLNGTGLVVPSFA